MTDLPFAWIADAAGVAELARALEGAPSHALDLESNSGFAYTERLCLLQVNVAGRLYLVDLLALPAGRAALEPLRPALEDPSRRTQLHGGEFDVGCLKRDYDLSLRGVWDSQQAASFLGWEKTGYGTLVEKLCGVTLAKELAHSDWSRRPLSAEAKRYALDDVHYLPQVCQKLEQEIAAAELVEEIELANLAVEEAEWSGGAGPDEIWKIKGAVHLPPPAWPRLVALARWRDEEARRLDQPPGRLVNHQALLALARNNPKAVRELPRLGLHGKPAARWGAAIVAALEQAALAPPPVPPRPAGQRPDPVEKDREDRLKEWRQKEADRRKVPQQVVLPRRALDHLKRHGATELETVPQLGAKRIRLYGDELRALCALGE